MDIFVVIKHDSETQLNDKVRFDLSSTFVARPYTTANITKIEVKPTPTSSFLTLHDTAQAATTFASKDWSFDWIYESKTGAVDDVMEIEVKVTASDATTKTVTTEIRLMTEAEDALLSDDRDLVKYEHDILRFIPDGRSSWNYLHRRSQERILSYLFEKGYKNSDGSPFTKEQLVDKYDYKEWSTFMTLKLIFGTVLNSRGDIFQQKATFYEGLEGKANKTTLRIDADGDGESDSGSLDLTGPILVRR